MDKQDKIDRYIQGKLSDKDKALFEAMMQEDEALREEVELTRHISTAFQRKGEKQVLNEMMQIDSEEELLKIISGNASVKHNRNNVRKLIWSISSVAAAVLIVILFIGIQPEYSSNQLINEFYAVQPFDIVPGRGESPYSETQQEDLENAATYYEQGNYEQALALLDNITVQTRPLAAPEEVDFYTAVCLIETGDINNAIKKLDYLSSMSGSVYREDAQWELALVYVRIDQRSKAAKILEEIVSQNGYYAPKAAELKKKLEMKKWF